MSESPVRDREQAITRIADILPLDVFPYKTRREYAERIVDALLPQPDPEVERLRIVERSLMENLNAALADLEQVEESLRAVTEVTEEKVRRAHEAYWDASPPFTAAGGTYAIRAALRTVLSSHPEAQSTEERT